MRLDQRHYEASQVKEVKQKKSWQQCDECKDWLLNETYFLAEYATGPTEYWEQQYYTNWTSKTHRLCNACCHTALDVIDWLRERTVSNKERYTASYEKWVKDARLATRKKNAGRKKGGNKK
jgi:hypothetical protein